jgi:ABC-type dipeptide/oligopeptide/nickel transport system, ATPase component
MNEMIRVSHLNLSFGEDEQRNQVLYDVNLSVREGEIFGLVGESGSGKTTVLKCLAGLFTHWDGDLAIAGRKLEHRIDRALCRRCRWCSRILMARCIRAILLATFLKSRCIFTVSDNVPSA